MDYAFQPAPIVTVPVVGEATLFSVHRVYCIGRNYVDHAKEMGAIDREEPFFFCKPADALLCVPPGQVGDMPYPTQTNNLHYEIEWVVAIGKAGKAIPVAMANDHVWGYALGLDMTRRDLQAEAKKLGRPWEASKAFDYSAPLGPIYPRHRVGILEKGDIQLTVNGTLKQQGDISQLIWNVPQIIATLSMFFELQAGDLIFTGTPAGVGPVVKSDHLVGSIAGLGELQVRIV
jgi:fumarylpyruvate hydrolase